jgi:hypothetical protein
MVKIGQREYVLEGETLFRLAFEKGIRYYPKTKVTPQIRNGKLGYYLDQIYFTIEEIKKRQTT